MSAVVEDLDRVRAVGAAPIEPPRAFDRVAAIKRARELLSPAMGERDAPPYPVNALGPLADACAAIADHGQLQPAMAAQCLLGAASLLTQGLHNVETLNGARPLSLYAITLGDSGDGKSTAQRAALHPVREWQRAAGDIFRAELAEFEKAKAGRKKEDAHVAPVPPYRLIRDATVEGLRRELDTGPSAQGVFNDDAGAILAGYGMSVDHRAKTAGVFSGLWDDGHLSVSRATGGGRVERYGRRVALHWLIQPIAAAEALGDPLLSAQGFWPRFLAAWPAPVPPRVARPFRPELLPAVGAYWGRCAELLRMPIEDDADRAPVISLDDDARDLIGRAFERFETQAKRGELRIVKPFALRAAEQACRVAGVLSAFAGHRTVTRETVGDALAIVAYALDTWCAIVDEGAADPGAANALRLYEWLCARPQQRADLRLILNAGPACVRSREKRDAALELLTANGLAQVVGRDAFALMPEGEPEGKP